MPVDSESFVILENVDSTNNYAMGKIHSGEAKDGNAWFAKEQTEGKGQLGRIWETETGQNIILSIVADTRFLQVYQQFQLSVAVSLSCYDFFKAYHNIKLKIKWPNDLFWNDKKAGGILIENIIKGNIWEWAVIGIGININQTAFDEHLRNPVSVKQITGKDWDIIELAKELCDCLEQRYSILTTKNSNKILEEYNAVLYKLNEKVKLKKDNAVFETIIKAVSPEGMLLTKDTMERTFNFGEVEWVI